MEKVKKGKKGNDENERMYLLLVSFVSGIEPKAFDKPKNIERAEQIIKLVKEIK